MHAKQCIGRAANQYSCFTYTAWVETLYTGLKPKGGSVGGVLVRKGVFDFKGMPSPILGDSCTTFIKDLAIFPQKKCGESSAVDGEENECELSNF